MCIIARQSARIRQLWVEKFNILGVSGADGHLVKLRKSLSELRQALELFYEALFSSLNKIGFRLSIFSICLFIGGVTLFPIYVVADLDNSFVNGAEMNVSATTKKLGHLFTISDLWPCAQFLRIKIERRDDSFLYVSAGTHKESSWKSGCQIAGRHTSPCH